MVKMTHFVPHCQHSGLSFPLTIYTSRISLLCFSDTCKLPFNDFKSWNWKFSLNCLSLSGSSRRKVVQLQEDHAAFKVSQTEGTLPHISLSCHLPCTVEPGRTTPMHPGTEAHMELQAWESVRLIWNCACFSALHLDTQGRCFHHQAIMSYSCVSSKETNDKCPEELVFLHFAISVYGFDSHSPLPQWIFIVVFQWYFTNATFCQSSIDHTKHIH